MTATTIRISCPMHRCSDYAEGKMVPLMEATLGIDLAAHIDRYTEPLIGALLEHIQQKHLSPDTLISIEEEPDTVATPDSTTGTPSRHPAAQHLLDLFAYDHLPAFLQEVSKPLGDLAHQMADQLGGTGAQRWPAQAAGDQGLPRPSGRDRQPEARRR